MGRWVRQLVNMDQPVENEADSEYKIIKKKQQIKYTNWDFRRISLIF